MRYHFSFLSNYHGVSDYAAYDRETRQERRVHLNMDTMEASLTAASLTPELLNAFNQWRESKYATDMAHLTARYGEEMAAGVGPYRPAIAA